MYQKRVKKSQICVSRLLEALFVVQEKYFQVITDEGHYNNDTLLSRGLGGNRIYWPSPKY